MKYGLKSEDIKRSAIAVLTPPERLTVSQWADRHRYLPSDFTKEPGKWRTSRTPYLREVMDCLTPDNGVTEVCVMKGTQLGFSEAGLNWIGYIMSHSPAPLLMVNPTLKGAREVVRQKLDPMIDACEVVRDLGLRKQGAKATDSVDAKKFPGGYLRSVGSNSPSDLRSMATPNIFFDEVDGYELNAKGEGPPIEIAKPRSDTFGTKKTLYYVSTPVIKHHSNIEAIYDRSDKRKYHVPCPHCGHYQELVFRLLKWSKAELKKNRDVWYECAECQGKIEERCKTEMFEKGRWVETRESNESGLRGYHLSSLYSPYGWLSWADIVDEFLFAKEMMDKGVYDDMQKFENLRLGRTWDVFKHQQVSDIKLLNRRERYGDKVDVPMGGLLLTTGVDVQKNRIEYETVAWGVGDESWSVDVGQIPYPPESEKWKEILDAYLRKKFRHASGVEMEIECMMVDSNYATPEVYGFVRQYYGRMPVFACRGIGAGRSDYVRVAAAEPEPGVTLVNVGTHPVKSRLLDYMRIDEEGPGYCHFPRNEKYNEEYFAQLTSEHLEIVKDKRGYPVERWVKKPGVRNEIFDCRVYSYAGRAIIDPDFEERAEAMKSGQSSLTAEPESEWQWLSEGI